MHCPSYPEIRLAWPPVGRISERLLEFAPDAVHIATEGPIGLATRRACLMHGLRFTSSYHTQFPEYLRSRVPVPLSLSYAALRWFHGAATRCMVSTPTHAGQRLEARLSQSGALAARRGYRAVPSAREVFLQLPRPIAVYVGRLAMEKNIEAFLRMPWRGTQAW